jgi:ribose transport system permease protein
MSTMHIIASTQSIAGLVALALLIPMVAGQFDLSIGATANLSGITAVIVQNNGILGPVPALLLGTLIGLAIGFVNGFIVVKLRVNSFIATLGSSSIILAFLVIVTGGVEQYPVENPAFGSLTQTPIFGFQSVVVYLIIVAIIVWWILERTPAGRFLHATGGNPEAARLTGIRVDRWAWLSLMASGMLCGFAGVLFVSLTGPSLEFGNALLLPAFAAVFLGSTQLSPGKMNVWGTLIAIFVLAIGVQGLQLVTGVQWVAPMFNGVALILAVALAVGRTRRVATRVGQKGGGKEVTEATERLESVGVDEPAPSHVGSPGDDRE